MKKVMITALAASSLSLGACATTGYNDGYYNDGRSTSAGRAATGAAVGAAVGAGVGAVVPGVSTVQGAVAGGIAGAVLGAVVNGRQYYRDTRGYCYYVDRNGQPIYDNNTRC
jgi:uncharacterized protein YcfJ